MIKKKTVIAGALGECVHVAGVTNFLRLAETAGWRTVFLPKDALAVMLYRQPESHAALLRWPHVDGDLR